jgi:hypothetical protein
LPSSADGETAPPPDPVDGVLEDAGHADASPQHDDQRQIITHTLPSSFWTSRSTLFWSVDARNGTRDQTACRRSCRSSGRSSSTQVATVTNTTSSGNNEKKP